MKAVGEIAGDVVCACLLLKNVKFILVFFVFRVFYFVFYILLLFIRVLDKKMMFLLMLLLMMLKEKVLRYNFLFVL